MTYLDDLARRIRSAVDQELVPPDADHLFLLYAVLVRAKGVSVTASDVHDCWSAWMLARQPLHPSLVPYEELTPSAQAQDEPFLRALLATAGHQA